MSPFLNRFHPNRDYCNVNNLKALSTADFGKVMKQVYPQVRPRRLGTRGNSRYCYAGLKKKVKLEEPTTPECIPIRDLAVRARACIARIRTGNEKQRSSQAQAVLVSLPFRS